MIIPEPQGFSPETEREFDEISVALAALFEPLAHEGEGFEILEYSAAWCSVDLTISDFCAITPKHVEQRLGDMQSLLRKYHQFWCVRIWLYKPTDELLNPDESLWLEITKYGVAPYRGRKQIEVFENMSELYLYYWGKDFNQE